MFTGYVSPLVQVLIIVGSIGVTIFAAHIEGLDLKKAPKEAKTRCQIRILLGIIWPFVFGGCLGIAWNLSLRGGLLLILMWIAFYLALTLLFARGKDQKTTP